jgi:DTW domain-containing protein YfiP
MIRQSENLKSLPRICFSPAKPSNFRVRKQPHPNCYSTIEAIHHTIELVGASQGFSTDQREHDKLLTAFDFMVERQLNFIQEANLNLRVASYRREGQKKISS